MSDQSVEPPSDLKRKPLSPDQRVKQERVDSPAPSCLSLKSDRSMDLPHNFKKDALRIKQERVESPSCLSMRSDRSMDRPIMFKRDMLSSDLSESSCSLLTKVHLGCSVCSEVLREPVSTPCGHSYCRKCISSYCTWPSPTGEYACPQCGKSFQTQPALSINVALAGVLQVLQQVGYSPAIPAIARAGPGDVACDICPGQELRAVKTCLTCRASYCEFHVRQHYIVPALQRHTLAQDIGDTWDTHQQGNAGKMERVKEEQTVDHDNQHEWEVCKKRKMAIKEEKDADDLKKKISELKLDNSGLTISKDLKQEKLKFQQQSFEADDGIGTMELGSDDLNATLSNLKAEGEWEDINSNMEVSEGRDEGKESSSIETKESVKQVQEHYRVIVRFKGEGGIRNVNPSILMKSLNYSLGDILFAKVLKDGNLMLGCIDVVQQDKALTLTSVGGCEVATVVSLKTKKKGIKAVISGVPLSVDATELRNNLKGGKILHVQRLAMMKGGVKTDSESILLEVDGEILPTRMYLGYVSYPVRAYVLRPVRCYNCQRFGHVAANCRRQRRCARCGGDHDYGKCGTEVLPKCCNCGRGHSVAYGGCNVLKQQSEVQRVRAENQISYTEAVRVIKERKSSPATKSGGLDGSENAQQAMRDVICVDRQKLVSYIAEVIHSTEKVHSEKIHLVVAAAVNHLDLIGVTWEEVKDSLTVQS
ncbi:uncharacterized protein ACJ7VT_002543 isoform 1-T4 [Polymixia lowei]